MGQPINCQKIDCAFLLDKPLKVVGRNGSPFYTFPGICNHSGNPEIDNDGVRRYRESIGDRIEGSHESIDRKHRCPYCGAITVINDSGMTWCISKKCSWSKR